MNVLLLLSGVFALFAVIDVVTAKLMKKERTTVRNISLITLCVLAVTCGTGGGVSAVRKANTVTRALYNAYSYLLEGNTGKAAENAKKVQSPHAEIISLLTECWSDNYASAFINAGDLLESGRLNEGLSAQADRVYTLSGKMTDPHGTYVTVSEAHEELDDIAKKSFALLKVSEKSEVEFLAGFKRDSMLAGDKYYETNPQILSDMLMETPNDKNLLLYSVKYYNAVGNPDAAEEYAKKLLDADKTVENIVLYTDVVAQKLLNNSHLPAVGDADREITALLKKAEDAERTADNYDEGNPRRDESLAKAEDYRKQANGVKAKRIINWLIAQIPMSGGQSGVVDLQLSKLYAASGDDAKAREKLVSLMRRSENLSDDSPIKQGLTQLNNVYYDMNASDGDVSAAISAVLQCGAFLPDSVLSRAYSRFLNSFLKYERVSIYISRVNADDFPTVRVYLNVNGEKSGVEELANGFGVSDFTFADNGFPIPAKNVRRVEDDGNNYCFEFEVTEDTESNPRVLTVGLADYEVDNSGAYSHSGLIMTRDGSYVIRGDSGSLRLLYAEPSVVSAKDAEKGVPVSISASGVTDGARVYVNGVEVKNAKTAGDSAITFTLSGKYNPGALSVSVRLADGTSATTDKLISVGGTSSSEMSGGQMIALGAGNTLYADKVERVSDNRLKLSGNVVLNGLIRTSSSVVLQANSQIASRAGRLVINSGTVSGGGAAYIDFSATKSAANYGQLVYGGTSVKVLDSFSFYFDEQAISLNYSGTSLYLPGFGTVNGDAQFNGSGLIYTVNGNYTLSDLEANLNYTLNGMALPKNSVSGAIQAATGYAPQNQGGGYNGCGVYANCETLTVTIKKDFVSVTGIGTVGGYLGQIELTDGKIDFNTNNMDSMFEITGTASFNNLSRSLKIDEHPPFTIKSAGYYPDTLTLNVTGFSVNAAGLSGSLINGTPPEPLDCSVTADYQFAIDNEPYRSQVGGLISDVSLVCDKLEFICTSDSGQNGIKAYNSSAPETYVKYTENGIVIPVNGIDELSFFGSSLGGEISGAAVISEYQIELSLNVDGHLDNSHYGIKHDGRAEVSVLLPRSAHAGSTYALTLSYDGWMTTYNATFTGGISPQNGSQITLSDEITRVKVWEAAVDGSAYGDFDAFEIMRPVPPGVVTFPGYYVTRESVIPIHIDCPADTTAGIYLDGVLILENEKGGSYDLNLSEGIHEVVAFLKDSNGNIQTFSKTLTVDRTPPTVTLNSADEVKTASDSLVLEGSTEPNATVAINGVEQELDSGSFMARLALENGVNPVSVTACDVAGNKGVKTITVEREAVFDTWWTVFILPGLVFIALAAWYVYLNKKSKGAQPVEETN